MVKDSWRLLFSITGLLALILDARTAFSGASQGITLCLYTVIPSLFPFIFISSLLVSQLTGKNLGFLERFGKYLGMPRGSEGFLLIGLLGGYPTGAVCIADSYRAGHIKKDQAEILLAFCNNAGPAFIFGMASSLFSGSVPWILWGIHIASALLTALFLPKMDNTPVTAAHHSPSTAAPALNRAVRVMATVCGWVILFRILIAFCSRWFLWLLPNNIQLVVTGVLELSNGCCELAGIDSQASSFTLFSAFLSLGGVCVAMQTRSAAEPLSLQWYIPGKIIQCLISIFLCFLLLPILFPAEINARSCVYPMVLISGLLVVIKLILAKKTVAFPQWLIYNGEKVLKR